MSEPDREPERATPASEEPAAKEWWDDPRMPWKGKPGRQDVLCWIGFSLTGVYALVLLPQELRRDIKAQSTSNSGA